MKIRMTCDVEPKVKTDTLRGMYGDWQYDFIANDDGFLEKISIETTVPDYKKYQIRFEPYPKPETPDGTIMLVLFDHDFNNLIIEEFQYFEGMLSLLGNAVAVAWQAPWIELIAENEDEKPHAIEGVRHARVRNERIPEISPSNIWNMVMRAHWHSKVINPFLAFFREADRERTSFRFINAFFNAYFILEGSFGNKKWRNWEVREEFENSPEFAKATQKVIDDFIRKTPIIESKIRKHLDELKDSRGKKINALLDVSGIARLLVDTRGSLLHFSGDTTNSKGTPINHPEFEEIAEVAIRIAGETLFHLSNELDSVFAKELGEARGET